MQDPDPKCRHFVISWHFMAFWHVCQKANCITKSAFSAFSRLFPPFRLFHRIRLLHFSALVRTIQYDKDEYENRLEKDIHLRQSCFLARMYKMTWMDKAERAQIQSRPSGKHKCVNKLSGPH